MTTQVPRLRIACSGLVGAEDGSVASAGFEILNELLRRGHEVDFFSKRTYVYPKRLLEHPRFAYHACDQPRLDFVIARLRHEYAHWLGMQIGNAMYMRRIVRRMTNHHRNRSYDVELFLGQWAYGRVPRLPVVSWVQGPPGTDSRSVIRHRADIQRLCGWPEYAKLRAYSWYRGSRLGQPPFGHTDVTICGSRSSKETLVVRYNRPALGVRVLPYPVDLQAFRPPTTSCDGAPREMLWVGRIVPRKRLDLFLDAGAELIRAGTNLELTVIGGYPFARGYHELIERFPFPDRLTYIPRLAREEVRHRLQRATVLVQPSEEENFGSSIAEALACGTPVVLGPSNGTGDYMGDGGERFNEYSAASVAGAIRRVLGLVAHGSDGMRVKARKAAVEHFGVEWVVDRLEDILRTAHATDRVNA